MLDELDSETLAKRELFRGTRSLSSRLMRNGFFTASGVVVAGLAGLFTVPLFLRWLGVEGYALIISTAAIAALPSCLESGLSLSVTREVAANKSDAEFFSSAAVAYVIFGGITFVVAALSILVFGTVIDASSLTHHDAKVASLLFAFAFATERILDFSLATLAGMERFDVSSFLSTALVIGRAAISIIVLCAGGRLIGVGLTYATCSLAVALTGILISCRLADVRLRLALCRWSRLKSSLTFGAVVTVTGLLQRLINDGRMLLTGMLSGWAGMAMLSVGQKFPQAVCDVSWRAAETMVPFAVGIDEDDSFSSNSLFRQGTHHVIMLVLPSCIFLFLSAPTLVSLWLGSPTPIAISVLRLTSIAVVLDAIGLAAIQMLWGRGYAKFLLWLHTVSSAVCLAVTVLMVHKIGVAGAAIGLIGASSVASVGALAGIQRLCRVDVIKAFGKVLAGLAIPLVGLTCSTILVPQFLPSLGGKVGYILLLMVSATTYLVLLLLFGMDEGDRARVLVLKERLLARLWVRLDGAD